MQGPRSRGKPLDMRRNLPTLAEYRALAAQLVRRVPSERDRREVLVAITPDGEQRLADLSQLHKDQLRTIGPALLEALEAVLSEK